MTALPLELIIPAIYLLVLLVMGFTGKKPDADETGFIVGGRRLTLPAFVATLVTTWYGGILGVGEFSYLYGLSNWIVFGVPYYLFALLYALFLAGRIRSDGGLTIPDRLYNRYGTTAGRIGSVWTFFMTLPAPYVLMAGLLLALFTGWNLVACILLGTVFSMVYVLTGGFHAVVRTDKFQFVLMFGGFVVLLVVLVSRFGGLAFLQQQLPAGHLDPTGGQSFGFILVWYFIALGTFVDPGFHQRCDAAESPKVARNGILLSILFWIVFDFLTTATGLYARALMTGLENPAMSYPMLARQVLHPVVSGLFLTGLLATIMSTIDSTALMAAVTVGHDLLGRTRHGAAMDPVKRIRYGLALTAILSFLLAVWMPSVIRLWYVIGTLFIPPVLLPLLSAYFPRLKVSRGVAVTNLILCFLVPLGWLTAGVLQSGDIMNPVYPLGWQPMFPGLALSVILFGAGLVTRTRPRAS